jgi:predicted alpha/beta superfamily hydrolase
MFDGAASCSGSLWFPGWDSFCHTAQAPAGSIVYLSLGGKEEKTRNPAMAGIGDATRKLEQKLKQDPALQAVTLEWNPGGHFTEPQQRTAKGMAWLVHHMDRET